MARSEADSPSARSLARGSREPVQLREAVIEALGVHFANGDIEIDELERRLELAFATNDPGGLRDLLSDLPSTAALPGLGRRPTVAPSEIGAVPDRGVLAAIMGGTVRKGRWVVPRYLKVVAIMGGVELDLRDALVAPGITEIEVFAVMGGVEIIVPQGVRVETMGMAVMGGFEVSAGASPEPDQPVLRLSGLALAAGVDAAYRRPSTKKLKKFSRAVEKARNASG